MCPAVSTKEMVVLRTALTIMSAISLVVCVSTALVAISQFDGNELSACCLCFCWYGCCRKPFADCVSTPGTNAVDWRPVHKGYALHCVSTAAEWFVALLFVGSIITYIPEMRAVSLSHPTFRVSTARGLWRGLWCLADNVISWHRQSMALLSLKPPILTATAWVRQHYH